MPKQVSSWLCFLGYISNVRPYLPVCIHAFAAEVCFTAVLSKLSNKRAREKSFIVQPKKNKNSRIKTTSFKRMWNIGTVAKLAKSRPNATDGSGTMVKKMRRRAGVKTRLSFCYDKTRHQGICRSVESLHLHSLRFHCKLSAGQVYLQ